MAKMPRRPRAGRAPDLSGLEACVEDVRRAAADRGPGPPDPERLGALRGALSRRRLAPLYREAVLAPYLRALSDIGERGFRRVRRGDPALQGQALVLLDVAQALLQAGAATAPLQEVVSDLYDGFLGEEERTGVKPPDLGVTPPMVKWGRAHMGPYTIGARATRSFGAGAGVVSLPAANARCGLLTWAALAHETAGHDVLSADLGLEAELRGAVHAALRREGLGSQAGYWADRIGEAASDVMGVLHMGPAAAAGLVAFLRGMNAAYGYPARLRSEGPAADPHPADLLRAWLGAAAVRGLGFSGRSTWARALLAEAARDAGPVRLCGRPVPAREARRGAGVVARTVARAPMRSLEGHALGSIQDWDDRDEAVAAALRPAMEGWARAPARLQGGTYAAHAVAAAVVSALAGAPPAPVLGRLRRVLGAMHARNGSFGPLPPARPAELAPHLAWQPSGPPVPRARRRR